MAVLLQPPHQGMLTPTTAENQNRSLGHHCRLVAGDSNLCLGARPLLDGAPRFDLQGRLCPPRGATPNRSLQRWPDHRSTRADLPALRSEALVAILGSSLAATIEGAPLS
jgi:hypothetical protein